jgi:hypothetical protein
VLSGLASASASAFAFDRAQPLPTEEVGESASSSSSPPPLPRPRPVPAPPAVQPVFTSAPAVFASAAPPVDAAVAFGGALGGLDYGSSSDDEDDE